MVKISLNENVSKLKEKSKAKNTQDKYQGDWLKFIDYCKSFEDSNGYLKSTFLSAIKSKYAQFLSGPFTNMIFEIISEKKNKLKILIGSSTATIERSKYHFQGC